MRKRCSSIGGQAVIEGVMMRGKRSMATACRDEKGNIVIESKYIKPVEEKNFLFRVPFLRGFFNFFSTMGVGMGTLMRSGEVFEGEAEPSKFEKWCSTKLKLNVYNVIMGISVVMGILLSLGLFFFLPQLITSLIIKYGHIEISNVGVQVGLNFLEGFVRIFIFVGYIALTALMKDVRRVYMYHGAEHKTISCYEHDLELTPENAQKMTTVHDRCGTTFMFIVMVISVLVFSLTGWQGGNMWARFAIRVALLPVVSGVSYELLKFFAKYDNWFVRACKAPGLLLQKLTTRQPTLDMLECAIAAFKTVMDMDADPTIPEQRFNTKKLYKPAREKIDKILDGVNADKADGDWIICEAMGIERSEIDNLSHIYSDDLEKAIEYAKKRATGMPLWQVFGKANFYGYDIKINEDVLCPRPETEYLAEQAIIECNKIQGVSKKDVEQKDCPKCEVLDLCCGSGCIAIAIAKNTYCDIVASDISDNAIETTKENIKLNEVEDQIKVVKSNLFENIKSKFNVIVSNPPYIPSKDIETLDVEVKDHEPRLALDGGEDGLDYYRIISKEAVNYLKEDGMVACECGINQASDIEVLFKDNGYTTSIVKDLEGIDRIVIAKKLRK